MYSYAAKVDIGVVEEHNDDRVLVGGNIVSDGTVSAKVQDGFFLAAVCDGVGGLEKGYKAAEITLSFMSFLNRSGVTDVAIKKAIEEANKRVLKYQSENELSAGAMTTISGIFAENEILYVFNAGDSRVYRFRYKYVLQLSKDNSFVQDLVDLGEITSEEAKSHPKRNIINKCIGHEEFVNPKVLTIENDFANGDILMICSDGISDVLTNQDIQEIIYEHKDNNDLSDCCNALYSAAIEKGSKDNLSVILIRREENEDE